jgi:hypothetical protein
MPCCGFFALEPPSLKGIVFARSSLVIFQENSMAKKCALALALVVTALSLGGCFVGKGKGKGPAPIATRN